MTRLVTLNLGHEQYWVLTQALREYADSIDADAAACPQVLWLRPYARTADELRLHIESAMPLERSWT